MIQVDGLVKSHRGKMDCAKSLLVLVVCLRVGAQSEELAQNRSNQSTTRKLTIFCNGVGFPIFLRPNQGH